MKKMKKLTSMVLAMLMILLMALPVSAEETTYTITINNNKAGHTYEAYQVFSGTLNSDGTILSDITWGTGVNGDTLLTELKALLVGETKPFSECTSAAAVAQVLDKNKDDSEFAKKFAEIVAKHVNNASAVKSTAKYDEEGNITDYKISGLNAGYYFVKDDNMTNENDSYTGYILEVVKNVAVEHKGNVPEVKKEIVVGDSTDKKNDYNIGDEVTFKLTGTLPENYADYKAYKYVFHDTLSKGLTYKENTVKVEVDGTDITNEFNIATGKEDDGTTKLTISCDDLKAIENLTLTASSQIVVTYTATLNSDAVIGNPGNPNKVYLEFSNNPNADGTGTTGKTPEDTVVVFTFELDVTKVDGATAEKLSGAKFKLTDAAKGGKWVIADGNGKVTGWATDEGDGTEFTSNEEGIFEIIGLADGTYYLKETKAPDGYNKIDELIKLEIISEYDATIGVKKLTIKVDDGEPEDGTIATGIVTTTVKNNKGVQLPSTGGTGTTIFYLAGGILVLIAVVLLVTKKRMSLEK